MRTIKSRICEEIQSDINNERTLLLLQKLLLNIPFIHLFTNTVNRNYISIQSRILIGTFCIYLYMYDNKGTQISHIIIRLTSISHQFFFIPLYWRKVIALLTIRVTQYYLSYWTKMTLLDYNQCTPKETGQRGESCLKKKVK